MTSTQLATKTPEQQQANFLFQQAKVLSNTEIVPAHLKGKPDHIYAIIMTGHEIGIAPSTALQSFASINGKLTMSAELMRALILGAGHSLSFPESTTTSCTIIGKRKETGDTATVTYTKEDAERAGLWTSHTWKKYPRQLLSARATTELARLLFPDIIKGVSYTPEEIGGDFIEENDSPKFEVQNAHVNDEPIHDELPMDEAYEPLTEIFEEPMQQLDELIDNTFNPDEQKTKLVGNITEPQMRKIMATKTTWKTTKPELSEKLESWFEMKFQDRSHKTLTKQEASEYIEYIEYLKASDSDATAI